MSTLVICTRSPLRAAGPLSLATAVQALLSQVPSALNSSGFLERGNSTLTLAYSAIMPRSISTRSCQVSLSAEKPAAGSRLRRATVAAVRIRRSLAGPSTAIPAGGWAPYKCTTKSTTSTTEVKTLASGPYSPPLTHLPADHTIAWPVTFILSPLMGTPNRSNVKFHPKCRPDGQPKIPAAQIGVAEQNAEAGGIGDAEPGGVRVVGMQQSEDDAHGHDGGIGPDAGHQHLKTVAAEEQLLAGGSRHQQQPPQRAACRGRKALPESAPDGIRPPAAQEPEPGIPAPMPPASPNARLSADGAVPPQAGIGQRTVFEDAQRQPVDEYWRQTAGRPSPPTGSRPATGTAAPANWPAENRTPRKGTTCMAMRNGSRARGIEISYQLKLKADSL